MGKSSVLSELGYLAEASGATVDGNGEGYEPFRAASIAAMSIFFIPIIAS